MMNPTISAHKIGLNKGRPRVWLDGPRLNTAGFPAGTQYRLDITAPTDGKPGALTLIPDLEGKRKVSGRPGGKPIIDILGKDVIAAFGENAGQPGGIERVAVDWRVGQITVTPAEQ